MATPSKPADSFDDLNRRTSMLESDMKHMSDVVSRLAKTVEAGFKANHDAILAAEERHERRSSEVHSRISKWGEQKQVSWPVVISFGMLVMMIVAGLVQFINMNVGPVKDNVDRMIVEFPRIRDGVSRIDEREIASREMARMAETYQLKLYEDLVNRINRLEAGSFE